MYSRRHVSVMLLRHLRTINSTKRDFSWGYISRNWLNRRQINWDQNLYVLARSCTKQFEFIIAQRIRRTIQIIHLYTRIWNENILREFLRSWNRRILFNRRQLLVASVFVTSYNWEKERITDQEMYSYCNDIDEICKLKNSTVICPKCRLRLVVDVVRPEVTYCKCTGVECKAADEWEPFLERQDMLVWRKTEPNTNGLYAYKVYGCFNDVSAEDFLQVQIDVNYRKEWDQTAKELTILETDPINNDKMKGTCDIVYWEMIWPTLFANRDYVYQRRWVQDKEKGVIIIISKVTEHSEAPIRPNIHRVSSYWSYMVIKPYRKFNEAGIEFSLTYFDDPGISIPSAITSWVAMSGFPDYLYRMREASKQYKSYKLSKEETTVVPKSSIERDVERPILTQNNADIPAKTNLNSNIAKDEYELNEHDDSEDDSSDNKSNINEEEKDKTEPSDSVPDENQGFLSYFFITRLFA